MARKTANPSLFLVFAVLLIIGMCSKNSTNQSKHSAPSTALSSTSTSIEPAPTLAATSPLAQKYVAVDRLNQRATPDGLKLEPILRGSAVTIYEKRAGWVRTTPDGASPKWVIESHLCSGTGCYIQRATNGNTAPKPQSTPKPQGSYNSYSSSCPCSSHQVCIGPRGGRYCITSGGNKRYGI